MEKGIARIQRAISRQSGKVVEAPLKTKNAYRTLPLSADAIDVLKAQKKRTGTSEFVFPSPTGGPMSPDSVLHMLQRVLKRAGLPRIRFHDLRHSYVKHTTKIFSLRLKVFQAQPVPGALRKTRGAFQHLREGGTRNPVLQSCNKKRSSWSVPQSKMSLILYAISMRLSGYTSTLYPLRGAKDRRAAYGKSNYESACLWVLKLNSCSNSQKAASHYLIKQSLNTTALSTQLWIKQRRKCLCRTTLHRRPRPPQ